MRDHTPPPSDRPKASAAPAPVQMQAAGQRSGEGSASVLDYLVQDRIRSSEKYATERRQRS